jgi:hypothetical protein
MVEVRNDPANERGGVALSSMERAFVDKNCSTRQKSLAGELS